MIISVWLEMVCDRDIEDWSWSLLNQLSRLVLVTIDPKITTGLGIGLE